MTSQPKILITGASGFVGSWLVKEAISRGLETYAGIRSTSSRDLLDDPRTNFCILDFEDPQQIREQLEEHQFDFIVHNAGVTRVGQDSIYFKVNCDYSVMLAQTALEVVGDRLQKFVFISSIEAYGSADPTPEGVVDESIDPSPRTTYGQSKLRAETRLKEIEKLPLLIMRPTAVFGPGERDLFALWKTVKNYRVSPTVGTNRIKYTFIYVKDLVRVVIDAALSDQKNKGYFVSDGRIHKWQDFLGGIARALRVKTLKFTIPYLVLDTAVVVTKAFDRMTGHKSLLNDEQMAKAKAQSWDCDIAPLVTDFEFRPEYTLEDALAETTEWYQSKGWI